MAQALTKGAIRAKGIQTLLKTLGRINTEIFIGEIAGEPFDYSKHRHLFLYDDEDESLSFEDWHSKMKRDTAADKTQFPEAGAAFHDPAIMAQLKAACGHPDADKTATV